MRRGTDLRRVAGLAPPSRRGGTVASCTARSALARRLLQQVSATPKPARIDRQRGQQQVRAIRLASSKRGPQGPSAHLDGGSRTCSDGKWRREGRSGPSSAPTTPEAARCRHGCLPHGCRLSEVAFDLPIGVRASHDASLLLLGRRLCPLRLGHCCPLCPACAPYGALQALLCLGGPPVLAASTPGAGGPAARLLATSRGTGAGRYRLIDYVQVHNAGLPGLARQAGARPGCHSRRHGYRMPCHFSTFSVL